jgi:hypothetical protein
LFARVAIRFGIEPLDFLISARISLDELGAVEMVSGMKCGVVALLMTFVLLV